MREINNTNSNKEGTALKVHRPEGRPKKNFSGNNQESNSSSSSNYKKTDGSGATKKDVKMYICYCCGDKGHIARVSQVQRPGRGRSEELQVKC